MAQGKLPSSCWRLITLTWQDEQSHARPTPTDWFLHIFFSCVFFFLLCYFLAEKSFFHCLSKTAKLVMKPNCASTAIRAHLLYQHSVLQIIHSLLWISQTIRTLPRDWEKGSIWAFQRHWLGAALVCASVTGRLVRYLHLRSEHSNKESAFTSKDSPRRWEWEWRGRGWRGWWGCSDLELLSWARMPRRCQALFRCRSIARATSECVALWRTSKRLRWNSLIVGETWTPVFLKWSLSPSTPHSTELFIKDPYRPVWGESGEVFQGQSMRQACWATSKVGPAQRFSPTSFVN